MTIDELPRMSLPTITRYIDTMREPHGLFRTLGEPECERGTDGRPTVYAGGNAAIFRVRVGGNDYALKCFTRPVPRVAEVCRFVGRTESGLLLPAVYLPEEMFVYESGDHGTWRGVVLIEWADGYTLDFTIRKAVHDGDRERLAELAGTFDRMALELLAADWAHGDIKPENIMVKPGGEMKLTDYDSLFFPDMEGLPGNQTGTQYWQHPRRTEHYFNRHIDDYSIALLSATLHSLAGDPSLYGRFGNKDVFLFRPLETTEGMSESCAHIRDAAARSCNALLCRLLGMLHTSAPHIPGLAEVIASFSTESTEEGNGELRAFRKGAVWGYEDIFGNTAIPALFDGATEFSEGVAAVSLNGYNHFIGPDGRCVLNCVGYDAVKPFSEGVAAVRKGGLWGYIDIAGHEVVEPQYEKAYSFRNGLAKVTAPGKEEAYIQKPDMKGC